MATIEKLVYLAPFAFWFYRRWVQGTFYKKTIRIQGKVVIVTGANSGIGKETAIDLVKRGAKVYIACRDLERGEAARREIASITQSSNVIFLQLDLSSKKSIEAFVKEFKKHEDHLDILINNAGIGKAAKAVTEDGFDMLFGVNYLGPFYLTILLLDHLKKAQLPKVISVSSALHLLGNIDNDDLMMEKNFYAFPMYFRSKLAIVMFAKELARRHNITSVSLHPGMVCTPIWKNLNHYLGVFNNILYFILYLIFRTPKSGAQTTIFCAVEYGLEKFSGEYFSDCRVEKRFVSSKVNDNKLAKWLWDETEKILKISK